MTPKLQLALDMPSLHEALHITQNVYKYVDIIEAGTTLVLENGLSVVRILRALYPSAVILADIRISKAGAKLARAAFEAGANRVTVMSSATEDTIDAVVHTAEKYPKCEVQIEINDTYDDALLLKLRNHNIKHLIIHKTSEVVEGKQQWSHDELEEINRLKKLGFLINVTGGINLEVIDSFKNIPVDCFIVGRDICGADKPEISAKSYQEKLQYL